jgi:CRP-like cAMP-binding protein
MPELSHPFFDGVPAEGLEVLARITRRAVFAPGEALFEQGDSADSAYFLCAGEAVVSATVPGGGRAELATLGPGSVLGELALIDGHRRSARVEARQDVETLVMERNDLQALCAHHHPASLELIRRLCRLVAMRITSTDRHARAIRPSEGEAGDAGAARGFTAAFTEAETGSPFDFRPFLPALAIFSRFSAHDIDEFVARCRPWTLGSRRAVFGPGDEGRSCFVVVRGAIEVLTAVGGRRLGVLGPGKLFGELAPLLGTPRTATCRTLERATLLELPEAEFRRLIDSDERLSFRFQEGLLRNLMRRLMEINRDLERAQQGQLVGVVELSTGSAQEG